MSERGKNIDATQVQPSTPHPECLHCHKSKKQQIACPVISDLSQEQLDDPNLHCGNTHTYKIVFEDAVSSVFDFNKPRPTLWPPVARLPQSDRSPRHNLP